MERKSQLALIMKSAGMIASLGSFFVFAYLLYIAATVGLGDTIVPLLLAAGVVLFVLGEVLRWRAAKSISVDPSGATGPITLTGEQGIGRPTREALHEAVYNDAFRKHQKSGDGALNEAERMVLHLVPLHVYISAKGADDGIAAFGHTETRATLPYLHEIGLGDLATLLEGNLANDEGPASDPDEIDNELSVAGFDTIPERIDAYLDMHYPWAETVE